MFTAIDLLAKFRAGTDAGQIGKRFLDFAEAYVPGTIGDAAAAQALWRLRCAVSHSFGLYDPSFDLGILIDWPLPTPIAKIDGRWWLSVMGLYKARVQAIEAYKHDVLADSPEGAAVKFATVFDKYAALPFGEVEVPDGRHRN